MVGETDGPFEDRQVSGVGADGTGKGGEDRESVKRVRPTGRKNKAWFKYCKTLPTHLKLQTAKNGGKGGGGEDRGTDAGGGDPRDYECSFQTYASGSQIAAQGTRESRRAADPWRDTQGRRAGLPLEERCTVWISQKKRHCSQRRSAPDSLFCFSHLQNPPLKPTCPDVHNGVGSGGARCAAGGGGSGGVEKWGVEKCPHCSAAVGKGKLDKHLGRCNVLRKMAQQQALPYYSLNANSGAATTGDAGEAGGAGMEDNILYGLDERAFADKVLECYRQHVPPLDEQVLEAKGCERLFAAALAGGTERQDKDGSLYKHLIQDSSIIAHAQRRGIISSSSSSAAAAAACRGSSSEGGVKGEEKVFVEFGAGKGMLSLAVAQIVPSVHVALVDREEGRARSTTDKSILRCGGTLCRSLLDP
jgi:hypothetical protein